MASAGFGESTRYGAVLYAYVLGVLVIGGAGLVLGAALVWPEVQAWRGPGVAEVAPGVAGGVLAFLGLSVLLIGGYAAMYKLVADGVAAGIAAGEAVPADATSGTPEAEPGEPGDTAQPDEAPPEPSPSEIAWGATEEPAEETPAAGDEPLPGEDAGSDPLGERTE